MSFASLTVTDSDGAQDSTQATLSVNKAKDYKPEANAGPNQVNIFTQCSAAINDPFICISLYAGQAAFFLFFFPPPLN